MVKKVRYSKVLAVIFLTVLIWVWADLALDETLKIYSAAVSDATANQRLWVSINGEPSAVITELEVKGPAARIAVVRMKLKAEGLKFDFDAAAERMAEPGPHQLVLLPFLQKHRVVKELGVKVESCKPERLPVNVVSLAMKSLEIRCKDEEGNLVPATVTPDRVDMYAPEDWPPDKSVAWVRLTRAEKNDTTGAPIMKNPFVEMAPTEVKKADAPVEVKVLSQRLAPANIATPRVGFTMSATLIRDYKVEVVNAPDVWAPYIKILATLDARQQYEKTRYHVILEIYDSDAEPAQSWKRKLIYNFPPDCVRRKEIELDQPPVEAEFKLIKLAAPTAAGSAAAGS